MFAIMDAHANITNARTCVKHWTNQTLARAFTEWFNRITIKGFDRELVRKYLYRVINQSGTKAYNAWRDWTARTVDNREKVMHSVLLLLNKSLAAAFHSWRAHVAKTVSDRETVYASVARLLNRQVAAAVSQWRDYVERILANREKVCQFKERLMNAALYKCLISWADVAAWRVASRVKVQQLVAQLLNKGLHNSLNAWISFTDKRMFCHDVKASLTAQLELRLKRNAMFAIMDAHANITNARKCLKYMQHTGLNRTFTRWLQNVDVAKIELAQLQRSLGHWTHTLLTAALNGWFNALGIAHENRTIILADLVHKTIGRLLSEAYEAWRTYLRLELLHRRTAQAMVQDRIEWIFDAWRRWAHFSRVATVYLRKMNAGTVRVMFFAWVELCEEYAQRRHKIMVKAVAALRSKELRIAMSEWQAWLSNIYSVRENVLISMRYRERAVIQHWRATTINQQKLFVIGRLLGEKHGGLLTKFSFLAWWREVEMCAFHGERHCKQALSMWKAAWNLGRKKSVAVQRWYAGALAKALHAWVDHRDDRIHMQTIAALASDHSWTAAVTRAFFVWKDAAQNEVDCRSKWHQVSDVLFAQVRFSTKAFCFGRWCAYVSWRAHMRQLSQKSLGHWLHKTLVAAFNGWSHRTRKMIRVRFVLLRASSHWVNRSTSIALNMWGAQVDLIVHNREMMARAVYTFRNRTTKKALNGWQDATVTVIHLAELRTVSVGHWQNSTVLQAWVAWESYVANRIKMHDLKAHSLAHWHKGHLVPAFNKWSEYAAWKNRADGLRTQAVAYWNNGTLVFGFTVWREQVEIAVHLHNCQACAAAYWMKSTVALAWRTWHFNTRKSVDERVGTLHCLAHWTHAAVLTAFNSWLVYTMQTSKNEGMKALAINRWSNQAVSAAFHAWGDHVVQAVRLRQNMGQAIGHMFFRVGGIAFNAWVERVQTWIKMRRIGSKAIGHMFSQQRVRAFNGWAVQAVTRIARRERAAQAVLRCMNATLTSALNAWRACVTKNVVIRHRMERGTSLWFNRYTAMVFNTWAGRVGEWIHIHQCAAKSIAYISNRTLVGAYNTWAGRTQECVRHRTIVSRAVERIQKKMLLAALNGWMHHVDTKFDLRGKLEGAVPRWNNRLTASALSAWSDYAVKMLIVRARMETSVGIWFNRYPRAAFSAWEHWIRMRALKSKAVAAFRSSALLKAYSGWLHHVDRTVELRNKLETVSTAWNNKAQVGAMNAWKAEIDSKVELRGKFGFVVSRWNNMNMVGALNQWKNGVDAKVEQREKLQAVVRRWHNMSLLSALNQWKAEVDDMFDARAKLTKFLFIWNNKTISSAMNTWMDRTRHWIETRENAAAALAHMVNRTLAPVLNQWKAEVDDIFETRHKLSKFLFIWNNKTIAGAMNTWMDRTQYWIMTRENATTALAYMVNRTLAPAFNTWADLANYDRVVAQITHLGQYVPQDMITSIRTALGRTEAQERLVNSVCSLMCCDRASIFLVDVNTNELVIHGTAGAGIRIPLDSGIAGITATTGEYLLINAPYTDPRFNQDVDRATGYVTTSIISIPIFNEAGVVLGVLECINKKRPEGFDEIRTSHRDTRIAKELAMLAGITLTYSVSLHRIKTTDFVQVVPDETEEREAEMVKLKNKMEDMAARMDVEKAEAKTAHQTEMEAYQAAMAEAVLRADKAALQAKLEAALQANLDAADERFTIVCPDGAVPGQVLYVMSPLGKQIEVTVPPETKAGDLIYSYIGGSETEAEVAAEKARLEALQARAVEFWRGSCHRRPFNKWLRVVRMRVHKRQWRCVRKYWFRWHDLVLAILEQRKQLSPPPPWSTPLSGDNGAAPSDATDPLSGAQSVLRNALTSFMPEDNAPHNHPGASAAAAGVSPTQQWVSNMRPLTLESLNDLPPPKPTTVARVTREPLATRFFSSPRLRLIHKQRVVLALSYRSLKAPEPLDSLVGADAGTVEVDVCRTAFNGWRKLTLASKMDRLGKLAAFVRYAEWLLGRCFRKWRRSHLGWREAKLKGKGSGGGSPARTHTPVRKVPRWSADESKRWPGSADRAKAKAKVQHIGGQIKERAAARTPDRRQSSPMMSAAAAVAAAAAAAAAVRGTPEDRWLGRMRKEMRNATESPAKVHQAGAQP